MCRFVLFDLDGTLLNTLDDLHDSVNWALQHNGLPTRTQEEVRYFVGNGIRKLAERILPADCTAETMAKVYGDFTNHYMQHCFDKTRPYPGIPELLRTLKAQGYHLAIVSNKLQAGVTELQKKFFADTVEVAVGERPGIRTKPAPDLALTALQELHAVASEAIYIGDSDVDILTAEASGMQCISVTWGFRSREFLTAHGATTLVDTPAEIIDKLGQL